MPRALSAHAAARARDRGVKTTAPEACEQEDALAPRTPAASSLRKRTSSTENLVAAARLVRSESQKQLLQHAQMLATGASTSGALWVCVSCPSALVAHPSCVSSFKPAAYLTLVGAGDYPWEVEFSAVVAASSLLYGVRAGSRLVLLGTPVATGPRDSDLCSDAWVQGVAATYFAHNWHNFGSLFCVVTLCSLSADRRVETTLFVFDVAPSLLPVSLAHTACAQPAAWRPPTRWCAV
jgi:hypothetical protein